jgi:predicted NBD/HSP70 family sugar kinase
MTRRSTEGAAPQPPVHRRDQNRELLEVTQFFRKDAAQQTASIRDINYIKVMDLVHTARTISRSEIASILKLSKTTVTSVIARMLDDDVVSEVGKGHAVKGRKPLMLRFNSRIKLALGVEIGDTECRGVTTDVYAHPIGDPLVTPIAEVSTRDAWRGKLEVIATIRRLAEKVDPASILGVGIGIPGIYDVRHHTIRIAESLGLESFSTRRLEESIGFSVRVVNRANAAALGEKWHRSDQKCQNLLYISIGDGVGSGIIQEGRLVLGCTGSAGEIGHMTVLPSGPRCRCGSTGCLESLISRNIIIARAVDLIRRNRTSILRAIVNDQLDAIGLDHILQAAKAGDEDVLGLLEQLAGYIGIAVANAVSIVDPQLVVIGGEIGLLFGEFFIPTIKKTVRERARYFHEVDVAVSRLGELAACVGSAAFILSGA